MENLKKLVEDLIKYTKEWSLTEEEWYGNIDSVRHSDLIANKHITNEEFEKAIREEFLYALIYNRQSIKQQLENDIENYSEYDLYFKRESKRIEKKIQRLFKDFKVERSDK